MLPLRGATSDASASLATAWLPPQGDENLQPPDEANQSTRGSHACLLIQRENLNVLIDASMQPTTLLASLRPTQVDPESIDLILLTHGDHDHIGGLADNEGHLLFPDATLVMRRTLWEAWHSDGARGDADAFYDDKQRALVRALVLQIKHRVQTLEGSGNVVDGIDHIATPGHRLSHQAYEIHGTSGRLLHLGDSFVFPEIFRDLSRGNAFDTDAPTGVHTRQQLLDKASLDNTLCFVPHFPFPGLVNIRRSKSGFSWSPWNAKSITQS